MSRQRYRVIGWAVPVVYLSGAMVNVWAELQLGAEADASLVESLMLFAAFGWFALLGGLVVARRPGNPLGWMMASVGLMVGLAAGTHGYATYAYVVRGIDSAWVGWLAWPNTWYWYALLTVTFALIPLHFPTGTLPSPRWRPVLWTTVAATSAICIIGALTERITLQPLRASVEATVANPIGIEGLAQIEDLYIFGPLSVLGAVGIIGGVVALGTRFRGSTGVERQQMKWLFAVAALFPLLIVAELLSVPDLVGGLGFGALVNAIPLAIGLAILRYRLYDIDRIISRTVAYVLVVAVLGVVYAGSVVAFQAVLSPLAGGSDLAVAAATLAVAALFGPVRRRLREVADRRFNRSRYDAVQEIERFGARLRDEVDLDTLAADLVAISRSTLLPRQAGLWLRSDGAARLADVA